MAHRTRENLKVAHTPTIWTGATRRVLYRRLVTLFGPYTTWGKTNSPGNGEDAAFVQFCEAFATVVGAKSGKAVEHQIKFALPHDATWNRQAQSAILNKAAALEEGFINDSHLPTLLAVSRNEK